MTNTEYEVGKNKPPKSHQFKKGQSGNPKGRPKDKKADQLDVISLLNKEITISEKGRKRKASAFEAGLQAQVNRALGSGSLTDIIGAIQTFEKYGMFKAFKSTVKTGVAEIKTLPEIEDYRKLSDHYEKTGGVLPAEALGGPDQPLPEEPIIYWCDREIEED